jgi:membrane fusion protein (multidrug efflux system)
MSEVSKLPGKQSADVASEPLTVAEAATEAATKKAAFSAVRIFPERVKRTILLGVIPALVVAGAVYAYLQAGRFVDTENAYVQADTVFLAAEISGTIVEISVQENQRVEAGAELFRLNEAPFRIALNQTSAALAQASASVGADKLAYQQALAEVDLHQSAAAFARTQLERQQGLRRANLGTVQDLDAARYALDSALKQISVSQQIAARLLVNLNGDADIEVADHPMYLQAQAEREQSLLDLERTIIRAPFAGMVTNKPDLGDFVEQGRPTMAIVADSGMWIEANFKETSLTYIQPGQSVTVEVDAYPQQQWHGVVQSLSEATGAEFALLPPQNATGNWVKIVQRIPVKIVFDEISGAPPLRSGMSCRVSVDTGHVRTWRDIVPF